MFGHEIAAWGTPSPNACPEIFSSILKECIRWCKVGTYNLSDILELVGTLGALGTYTGFETRHQVVEHSC
jgi:hypothetical protein